MPEQLRSERRTRNRVVALFTGSPRGCLGKRNKRVPCPPAYRSGPTQSLHRPHRTRRSIDDLAIALDAPRRVRLESELRQALGEVVRVRGVRTINEHVQNLYEEEELDPEATIRKFRIVRREGESDWSVSNKISVRSPSVPEQAAIAAVISALEAGRGKTHAVTRAKGAAHA